MLNELQRIESILGEGLAKPCDSSVVSHLQDDGVFNNSFSDEENISSVMLNLFQHLADLAFALFSGQILKQVQDDGVYAGDKKSPERSEENHLITQSLSHLVTLAGGEKCLA